MAAGRLLALALLVGEAAAIVISEPAKARGFRGATLGDDGPWGREWRSSTGGRVLAQSASSNQSVESSFSGDIAVPENLSHFEHMFSSLRDNDMSLGAARSPKRNLTKMILGVFTSLTTRSKQIRYILRETWIQHPDVCLFTSEKDCAVRVAFVACDKGMEWMGRYVNANGDGHRVLSDEPDVVLLNIKENMNEGKTFEWFRYVSRAFTGVDFVGKLDDDAFLHVTEVLNALPVKTDLGTISAAGKLGQALGELRILPPGDECEAYLGKPWTCLQDGVCPSPLCGPPMDRNFTEYNNPFKQLYKNMPPCWSYMQGGFYAMSRKLAEDMTKRGSYWDENKVGDEDLITGKAVFQHAQENNVCVRTWDGNDVAFDRMFHHARARNERPAGVSGAWDLFYGKKVVIRQSTQGR